jgi:AcrR family transcriptional regulator
MARRKDHSRGELKDLILDAAWEIVGKEGLAGLSARRIATDIGYAPGTIYNVFPSMDALVMAVNARTLEQLAAVLNSDACKDSRVTPVQNMKTMAQLYMRFASEYRPYWLMLFTFSLPDGQDVDGWYQEMIDNLFNPLQALLEQAFPGKEHEVRRGFAARILWSSVHGICMLQETGKFELVGRNAPAEDMASYLIDTFVAGMIVQVNAGAKV